MYITYLIILVTVVVSILALRNPVLLDKLVFWPYKIWNIKEWHRLVSCCFVHGDFNHLFFNMFALYSFGPYIEATFSQVFYGKGPFLFIIMYFGAVATADIYNLFQHRDDYNYRSLGASGGVSAVIFSFILFNPFGKIFIFFIPVGIPAVLFGGLYLFYCAYMARRQEDNIGHIAHFTGSVFGFVFPALFEPRLFANFVGQLIGTR